MSALIKCKACGKDVAKSAKACPQCGAPVPGMGCLKLTGIGIGGFIAFLFVVGVIGAIAGGGKNLDKTADRMQAQAMGRPAVPSAPSEQVIVIRAPQLSAAYKANEIAADEQFKDKLVEVTGIVGDIKKDMLSNIYVTVGSGAMFEIPTVQAFFDDQWKGRAASLHKGQKITVRCRVSGLMMNVLAKECEIVQ